MQVHLNPIPPRLFSNLFPLGGGRYVSHLVELDSEFFLHQNFSLSGLRVSIADFGFKGPGFNSQKTNIFTKKKKRYSRDLNTGPLVPKSAMLAPRPQIDEKCLKNQKKFGYIFSNSKFFKFLVMNYETHSSQMCRRLEIILS